MSGIRCKECKRAVGGWDICMSCENSLVELHKELLFRAIYNLEIEKNSKNQAYKERNMLVAAFTRLFPATLERHPEDDKDWEDDWRWVVFIDFLGYQASWHIHDSDLTLFDHLPRNVGVKWDGHTTEEKYKMLENINIRWLC